MRPICTALLAMVFVVPCFAQKASKETYAAFAVRTGTQGRGRTPIQINITRWTTESERNALLEALVDKGQPTMVTLLGKQDSTGFLRLTAGTGTTQRTNVPIKYAWLRKDGENRRIVILADRYVQMFGSSMAPRDNQHNLTIITFVVDAEGKGDGTMVSGVKVKVDDKNAIVLESALTPTIDLKNVERIMQ